MPKKKFIVQLTRVPCHAALIVRASQGVNKIRRVGNDQVEFIFRVILAEVAAYNFHPIAPGGRLNILLGLCRRCRIYLDRGNYRLRITLC